jgi:hypothetical protein
MAQMCAKMSQNGIDGLDGVWLNLDDLKDLVWSKTIEPLIEQETKITTIA